MVSMDMVAIFSGILALFISFLTLGLTHLRGVAIALSVEKWEMPEISPDNFKHDIPTTLRGTTSLFVLNKGNRTGAIKVTKLDFVKEKGFANFLKEYDISIQSIESYLNIKSHLNHSTTLPKTVIIKDGSADLINIVCSLKLNPVIWKMSYDYNLETINIESNDLRELLNELFEYKKERLKDFINFLRSNEKLGKISISWEYTKRWPLWGTAFKKGKEKSVDVVHTYKKTLEYYGDALKNYQLEPQPKEIIKSVLSEIDKLKDIFDLCYVAIEQHRNEKLFPVADSIRRYYIDRKNRIIELLKKCGDYKEFIEMDIKPLLDETYSFCQKTEKERDMPQGASKQKLIDKIKGDREDLRKKLIMVPSTLENLEKAVKHELEEMS